MDLDEVISMLETEMERHGLLERGWTYGIEKPKGRLLGICKYDQRVILISDKHVSQHARTQILDTIRHEIAHALVGADHGHDAMWKAKAVELGANPSPCNDVSPYAIKLGYDKEK